MSSNLPKNQQSKIRNCNGLDYDLLNFLDLLDHPDLQNFYGPSGSLDLPDLSGTFWFWEHIRDFPPAFLGNVRDPSNLLDLPGLPGTFSEHFKDFPGTFRTSWTSQTFQDSQTSQTFQNFYLVLTTAREGLKKLQSFFKNINKYET